MLKILEQSREYKLVSNERVKEIEESLNACTESYANSQIDDKTIDRYCNNIITFRVVSSFFCSQIKDHPAARDVEAETESYFIFN